MITVSASYVSGDRDNHANGVRIAVCSLLNDVAFKHGFHCYRDLQGPDKNKVVYTVELPADRQRSVVFLKSLIARGACPAHQFEILYETKQDSLTLVLAGVYTQPESVRAVEQEEHRQGQEGADDGRPVEGRPGAVQGQEAG